MESTRRRLEAILARRPKRDAGNITTLPPSETQQAIQNRIANPPAPRPTNLIHPYNPRIRRHEMSWLKTIDQHDPDFTVRVFHHDIGSRSSTPCWVYVSDGLYRYNQSEIVFSLLQRSNEPTKEPSEAPIMWMRLVCDLARQGLHLEIGQPVEIILKDKLQFSVNAITVPIDEELWKEMRGFDMLIHGIPLRESIFFEQPGSLPKPRHHVIAFTKEEAALVKTFGVTRIVSHLGLSHKWFPYPPWIDRDRKDCCSSADFKESIKARLDTVQIRGVAAIQSKNYFMINIPRINSVRDAFRAHILDSPSGNPLAFDSYLPEDVVAGAIWKTGDTHPAIYAGQNLGDSPEGNRVGLAFIVLSEEGESHSQRIEDGGIVFLKPDDWKNAKVAIAEYENLHIPLDDYTFFALVWS